jgi:hypothetical protein
MNAPKGTKLRMPCTFDIRSRQRRYDDSSACDARTSCRKDASRNRDSSEVIQKSVQWVLNYNKSGGLSLRFATLARVTSESTKQHQQQPTSHVNRLSYVLVEANPNVAFEIRLLKDTEEYRQTRTGDFSRRV